MKIEQNISCNKLSEVKSKTRNVNIDILKGCGLFLMVAIHARCYLLNWAGLFHMAVFFIASGYLYNDKYSDNIKNVGKFIFRKIKGLWLPYAGYSILFILLNNVFISTNIYTNNPLFQNADVEWAYMASYMDIHTILQNIYYALTFQLFTQLGGTFWFFETLFLVLCLYFVIDFLSKKLRCNKLAVTIIHGIVSVLLLTVGYICCIKKITLTFGVEKVCSVYILIFLGTLIKRYNLMEKLVNKFNYVLKSLFIVISITFFAIMFYVFNIHIDIASNAIYNPILFIVFSLLGWCLLYLISDILVNIKKSKCTAKVITFLCYLSRHAVPVMALHLLCFKIVNIIGVYAFGLDSYLIAAFPVLFKGGIWWIPYTILGLLLPLLLIYLYEKCKKFIIKKIKRN